MISSNVYEVNMEFIRKKDAVEENTVEYVIYKQIDAKDKKSALILLVNEYLEHLEKDLHDHIWQNDAFNLKPVVNERGKDKFG